MTRKYNFRPIPANLADRFPDGDYTVGRGADPRSLAERMADAATKPVEGVQGPAKKPRKAKPRKRLHRPAAE